MPSLNDAKGWYAENDPVHGFGHIERVYRMAERLADLEGADIEIVRAAALLHDAEGAPSARESHHHASAAFAGKILRAEGWEDSRIAAVQHCIRAHRFRDPSETPRTLEAKILFDADKLDAIGAIGAARALAYAACHGAPFYAPPSAQFIETGTEAEGEIHTAYHEYLFKLRTLRDRMYTDTARTIAEARIRFLDSFFERLAAEWEGRA